jgi:phosphoglycolate phosphatase
VRGIVFDLDGTLVDSYEAIRRSLNHARAAFGLLPLDLGTVRQSVGHGLEALIEKLCAPADVPAGVALFRSHYAEVYAEHTIALPGVADCLDELARRGFRLAVASNKPAYFSRPILEQLGLARHLAEVLGPDIAGTAKPEPAMLALCLSRMALPAGQALYVGDMALDAETAARAGIPVVLVAGGSSSQEELAAAGPRVLHSLGELCDLLPRSVLPGGGGGSINKASGNGEEPREEPTEEEERS